MAIHRKKGLEGDERLLPLQLLSVQVFSQLLGKSWGQLGIFGWGKELDTEQKAEQLELSGYLCIFPAL